MRRLIGLLCGVALAAPSFASVTIMRSGNRMVVVPEHHTVESPRDAKYFAQPVGLVVKTQVANMQTCEKVTEGAFKLFTSQKALASGILGGAESTCMAEQGKPAQLDIRYLGEAHQWSKKQFDEVMAQLADGIEGVKLPVQDVTEVSQAYRVTAGKAKGAGTARFRTVASMQANEESFIAALTSTDLIGLEEALDRLVGRVFTTQFVENVDNIRALNYVATLGFKLADGTNNVSDWAFGSGNSCDKAPCWTL